MDAKNIEFFRKSIQQMKDEILRESSKEADEGKIKVVSEELADVMDRSSLETDRNFTLRLMDRDRRLLKKIDEALDRLDKGQFGFCDDCGEEIAIGRLKARPVATLCISCKEDQEKEEKRSN